jgi:hypothetical protein
MLNLDPNAHTARNLDQPNFDHLPLVPQEFAAIAVSSADSDAPLRPPLLFKTTTTWLSTVSYFSLDGNITLF